MSRNEFMKQLEYLLRNIPENEKQDALAYYQAYFDEAGAEKEQDVILELGSPESVAQTILADLQGETEQAYSQHTLELYEKAQKKRILPKSKMIWIAILTFPLWIGVFAGLFGVLIGVLGALFGVVIGFAATGLGMVLASILLVIKGIFCGSLLEGLAIVGVGLLCLSVGLLMVLVMTWLFGKWLPMLCRGVFGRIKSFVQHKKGGITL